MSHPALRAGVFIGALFGATYPEIGFGPQAATANDERTVTVGVYQNEPKIYTGANGRPAGLFIDLLQAMARREGWTLQFVPCTWASCLHSLEQGRIDLMPDVAYSAERAARFDFHHVAVANSWSQVYRNAQTEIRDITDLRQRRVAVLQAAIQEEYLKRLISGAGLQVTLIPVEDFAAGFAAVRDGRADAVVTNAFFGSRFAARYGVVETPILFNPVGLYYATGKGKNGDLLQRIDHYLAQWRQDPESVFFAAMRAAMMPLPETVVPRWLKIALSVTACVVVLLLAFSLLLRWQVRRATDALRRAHRRLDQVLAASPVVLYLLRPENGEYVTEWISPNIERLFGFQPAHAQERGWFEKQVHPEDRHTVLANFARNSGPGGELTQEYRLRDAKGVTRFIRDEMRVTTDIDGEAGHVVGTWTDLTQAVKHAADLRFLTQHEPVTGLPNRSRLLELLAEKMLRAGASSASVAVLAIDFAMLDDLERALGHAKQYATSRAAARKLETLAGPDDTLAQMGDDSFVLLLGATSARHASRIAERLLEVFNQPLSTEYPYKLTASIGISVFPDDAADPATLLEQAGAALDRAKREGRNTYRTFAAERS